MIKQKLSNEKGQALVEFILILPILIILVCAILDFGWLMGNQLLSTYGCREGARYAAVNALSNDYQNDVSNRVIDVMPEFTHDGLTVSATRTNIVSPRDGDVVVNIDYTFDLLTPFAIVFFGGQEYTVQTECTMKAE